MTIAIDTNVISGFLSGTPTERTLAQQSIRNAAALGKLTLSPVVYAELLAMPGRNPEVVTNFLQEAGFGVDWQLKEGVWLRAARAYRDYAERRRQQQDDSGPRRILADFIVGAHAQEMADALLTFDQKVYKAAFPGLRLLE